MSRRPWLMLPVISAISVGCGHDVGAGDHQPLPWDAVDVPRVVISADPAEVPEGSLRWSLAPEPSFEVGGLTEDDEPLFGSVRDLLVFDTGHVVVIDVQANEVLFFDAEGELLNVAPPGDGPGEVRVPMWLGECAPGSAFVYDLANGRMSVFTAEGAFVRMFTLGPLAPGEVPADPPRCSRDGYFLWQAWVWTDAEVPEGPFEGEAAILLADPTGETSTLIGSFPTEQWVGLGGQQRLRPVGSVPLFGISEEQIYLAVSRRPEVGVWSSGGTLRAVIGFDLPARPVTGTEAERQAETGEITRRGLEGDAAERVRNFYREYAPETLPHFDRLLVAPEGNLWIRHHPASTDAVSRWDVVSAAGVFEGFLEVPRTFDVHHVGRGVVAGTWTGAFDEQYVRVYELLEPS